MAVIGLTSKVEIDTNGSGSWSTISEATMINVPSYEVSVVDASHLAVSSANKLFIPGMKDAGVLSFECNYTKATLQLLNTHRGIMRNWRVTFVDDDGTGPNTQLVMTFEGFITKTETALEMENVVRIKTDVKVSGGVTLA
jgi:hypothetical protein